MIKKYKPNSLQELKELVSDKSVTGERQERSPRRHRHFADNGHDGAF